MKRRSFLIALALSSISCRPVLLRYVQVDNPANRLLLVTIVGSTDQVAYLNDPEVAALSARYRYVPIVLNCEFSLADDRRYWANNYLSVSFEYYMKHRNCPFSDRDWDIVNDLAVTSTPEFRIYSADGSQLLRSIAASAEDERTIAQLRQFLVVAEASRN